MNKNLSSLKRLGLKFDKNIMGLTPEEWKIKQLTNVIAFDEMGYPLRLVLIEETQKQIFRKPLIKTSFEFVDISVEHYEQNKDDFVIYKAKEVG